EQSYWPVQTQRQMTQDLSMPEYVTEASLVGDFIAALRTGATCWGPVQIVSEWVHSAGSVDVLCRTRSRKLVAFEAKLSDWRRAFHQAFRNGTYANRVYVVLPIHAARIACKHRLLFEAHGVGLCSINRGRVHVHVRATPQPQLLTWVTQRAHSY